MRAGEEGRSLWNVSAEERALEEAVVIAQGQAEQVIDERGGALVGDEVAVFGQVLWTPNVKPAQGLPYGWKCGKHEQMRETGKVAMSDGSKVDIWQNLDKESRHALRGVEFICGLFSPSTGRLSVAGTHLNEANKEEARCESYDLELVEGGSGAFGEPVTYSLTRSLTH